MAWNQMQRLLMHRAAFNRIDRPSLFEAALNPFDQRAFPRTDWTHQIKDLPALFTLQRSRMEIPHDMRDRPFDSEEFVGEEVINLVRLVFDYPFLARLVRAL